MPGKLPCPPFSHDQRQRLQHHLPRLCYKIRRFRLLRPRRGWPRDRDSCLSTLSFDPAEWKKGHAAGTPTPPGEGVGVVGGGHLFGVALPEKFWT